MRWSRPAACCGPASSNAPLDATMLGFAPASVAATGSSPADVVTNTGGSDGFTFDKDGNMWVLGGTTADSPVARYPASVFATDGEKNPDITIDSPSFGDSIPGAEGARLRRTGKPVGRGRRRRQGRDVHGRAGRRGWDADRDGRAQRTSAARRGSPSTAAATSGWPRKTYTGIMRIDAAHLTATGCGRRPHHHGDGRGVVWLAPLPDGHRLRRSWKPLGELRWDHREHSGRRADWNREQDDYAARS